MMIAVTGFDGRLGRALVEYGCIPLDCDVTSWLSVREAIKKTGIGENDTIIHCAAITDVDGCEVEYYKDAIEVNIYGTVNVREQFDGRVIYISTDYIFDGKSGAYSENAKPNPLNHYGQTKLYGEEAILEYGFCNDIIVRTTMLYGGRKPDFVTKILNNLSLGKPFGVPKNLFGTPTYIYHLAEALMVLANMKIKRKYKIINIAGDDYLSRYEFAIMVSNVFGYDSSLIIPYRDTPGKALRPLKCGLKTTLARKLGIPIKSAYEGLMAMREGRYKK